MHIRSAVAVFCVLFPAFTALSQIPCDPLSYFNESGQELVYRQAVPTPWFAVRMTADWVATIDTAFIGMGVERAMSSGMRPDTLEVRVLANQLPTYFILDQFIALIPPNLQGLVPDAMYIIEFTIDSPIAWVDPPNDFYLAWRVRGPSGDVARIRMMKPAQDPTRSIIINQNNTTTLATDYMRTQLQLGTADSVDFRTQTHVCWQNGTPVELTSFTARSINDAVLLEWHTATEENNSGFSIERLAASSDKGMMNLWERIGFVDGHGTTTAAQSYSFIDSHPLPGANPDGRVRYRLRQIDFDGRTDLSPIVEITLPNSFAFSLEQNYPNPVRVSAGSTIAAIALPSAQSARLELFDALGRSVALIADRPFSAGRHQLLIPLQGLRTGMYFYRLTSAGQSLTRRLSVVE
ncbi:MAG: T9SS type A sorting domain-containing protein [Bacteroidetes bacterium]|nr:T9SS type A sorting domain-containing protein [Bacteroidota bacterium]